MTMKTKAFLLGTLFAVISMTSFSQNAKRFGIEINSGASFATQKLAGTELDLGWGFEGLVSYNFFNNASVIAGWGWNGFSADESFAGAEMDFEETGYILGLEYSYPVSKVSVFARGAALYNHIEVENDNGDIIHDTGHGFGWQAAAGVHIPLGKNWILSPGVKFNSLSRELDLNESTLTLDQKYLSVRVGITKKF